MRHRYQLMLIVAGLLIAAGVSLYHKTVNLDMPLRPDQMEDAWAVEAHIDFVARDNAPMRVEFPLPENPPGFSLISEDFVTREFGLTIEQTNGGRQAVWSVRRASGNQSLYYRAIFYRTGAASISEIEPPPAPPSVPDYPEPLGSAIMAVLEDVRRRSANIETFTRTLLSQLNAAEPDEDTRMIRGDQDRDDSAWAAHLVQILAGARITARPVYGIQLEDGSRRVQTRTLLTVYNGEQWLLFDPRSGQQVTPPEDFLIWHVGDHQLVSFTGAHSTQLRFSVSRHIRPQTELVQALPAVQESALADFSLMALPVETQNLYRILFTLPIGALLVVFMRNMIGVSTFGTFMPVLIALAFRETQLGPGIVLFTLLVAAGLLVRFYMERLQLLFVPRIAAVLSLVILMMALVSIVSNMLDYRQGLMISVFPMVILAMTIERMSVVWEEQGAQDALTQAAGSLLTAVLGYLLMTQRQIEHMVYVFPETLLVVLALLLLCGRYTGYRLTELWRFRHMLRQRDMD